MTLQWAWTESSLSGLLKAIQDAECGFDICQPDGQPPISLKSKLKTLSSAFRSIYAIEHLADSFKALSTRLTILKQRRHEITHGAALAPKEGKAKYYLFKARNGRLFIEGRPTSLVEIIQFTDALEVCEAEGFDLLKRVMFALSTRMGAA